MKRMFLLLTTATMITASPAFAGSNTCYGKLTIHPEGWTTVIDQDGYGCQFQTKSPIGKKIIAVCPHGSECDIDIELDAKGGGSREPVPVIRYSPKDIISVDRVHG
jgi:hypothetical protein